MKQDIFHNRQRIRSQLNQLRLTATVLDSDLRFAIQNHRADPSSQFWRRTVIRCLMALMEAVVWNMKQLAPKVAEISGVVLTPKELQLAAELQEVPTAEGTQYRPKSPKFPRFPDSLAAAFTLFAKVHRVPQASTRDQGFDDLCATYRLRSRLMHPKTIFDPAVTDSDIANAQSGVAWWNREYGALMARCAEAMPHPGDSGRTRPPRNPAHSASHAGTASPCQSQVIHGPDSPVPSGPPSQPPKQ